MRRQLPSDEHVKDTMVMVLKDSEENGHRATVTAVERTLEIPHATFARNYPHLIEWFKAAVAESRAAVQSRPSKPRAKDPDEVLQRLRTENTELRKIVNIYAAEIQRLTLENDRLTTSLNEASKIRSLPSRRHADAST